MSVFARLSRLVRARTAVGQTPSMESLENRTLLSVAPLLPAVAVSFPGGGSTIVSPTPVTPTPISAVTTIPVNIQAVVGIAYNGDVGMIKGLSPALLPRLQATVQWGDGVSVPEKALLVFDSAGILHIQGTHAYAKAGTFAVTVNVLLAPPAGSLAPTQKYTINSSATVTQNSRGGVTIFPVLNQPFTGAVGTLTYVSPVASPMASHLASSVVNPVAPTFTAQIQWGDGVASVGKVVRNTDGTYSVDGTHTYDAVGTYRIVVLVTEQFPGTNATATGTTNVALLTTIYSTAVVQAAPPVANA